MLARLISVIRKLYFKIGYKNILNDYSKGTTSEKKSIMIVISQIKTTPRSIAKWFFCVLSQDLLGYFISVFRKGVIIDEAILIYSR